MLNKKQGEYHYHTDWFALGLILHECLTKELSVPTQEFSDKNVSVNEETPECDKLHEKILLKRLPQISKDLEL